MSLSAIGLAAAASFACINPTHHDGDNLRCANVPGSMRLQGIDAPEMPGACRPGRACTPGDPYAARDYLRGLTAGKTLTCEAEDTDVYGRTIVNCTAGDVNISCAMIASGHAVPRYAPIDCSGQDGAAQQTTDAPSRAPAPRAVPEPPPIIVPADTPEHGSVRAMAPAVRTGPVLLVLIGLLLANAITWALFAIDKRRAVAGRSRHRIPEATLLAWAALGGSPAAWHAIARLRHKSAKDSFKLRLLLISGVQAGLLLGGLYWWATA